MTDWMASSVSSDIGLLEMQDTTDEKSPADCKPAGLFSSNELAHSCSVGRWSDSQAATSSAPP